jgi:hypothetical protein
MTFSDKKLERITKELLRFIDKKIEKDYFDKQKVRDAIIAGETLMLSQDRTNELDNQRYLAIHDCIKIIKDKLRF